MTRKNPQACFTRLERPGATVLTLEDHSVGLVGFVIALRYGAATDPEHQSGRLHSTLELMLRGTQQTDRYTFHAGLERLGSHVHGCVGQDTAVLEGMALARHLPATLSYVAEAWLSPALNAQAWDLLQRETLDTLRIRRDDDEAVADYFLRQALYGSHLLSRPPEGHVADIQNLQLADIHAAYQQARDSDLIFGLAGSISPEEALCSVSPFLENRTLHPFNPGCMPTVPHPMGLHMWVIDKEDRTQVQLRLASLGLSGLHPDVDAFWLGITAFGGTFTSPLTRQVRDERGWSYVAQADFRRRSPHPSPVILRTAPALEDAVNCLELKLALYQDLVQGHLDISDVRLARDYLLNRYPLEVATAFDTLSPICADELLGLPATRVFTTPDRLQALDVTQVPHVVARHLHAHPVLALLVGPAAKLMPALERRFPHAILHQVDFREGLDMPVLPVLPRAP